MRSVVFKCDACRRIIKGIKSTHELDGAEPSGFLVQLNVLNLHDDHNRVYFTERHFCATCIKDSPLRSKVGKSLFICRREVGNNDLWEWPKKREPVKVTDRKTDG